MPTEYECSHCGKVFTDDILGVFSGKKAMLAHLANKHGIVGTPQVIPGSEEVVQEKRSPVDDLLNFGKKGYRNYF